MILKVITHKKSKAKIENNLAKFQLQNMQVKMPKKIGVKILKLIKKRRYSLIEELIDIYKDNIVTNF